MCMNNTYACFRQGLIPVEPDFLIPTLVTWAKKSEHALMGKMRELE